MSKALKKQQKLDINGKEIVVKKLPIRKVIGLLEEIGKIPETVAGMDKMSNEQLLENLPMIIATSLPVFADVVVKAIDDENVNSDWLLDECGFDDALELIEGILEVNNVAEILNRVKKVQALVGQGSSK